MTEPINPTPPVTPTRSALGQSAGSAFRVSAEQIKRGYFLCPCGKYAHVTDYRILRDLPRGYSGEMCAECHCLMLPVDRLPNAELTHRMEEEQ